MLIIYSLVGFLKLLFPRYLLRRFIFSIYSCTDIPNIKDTNLGKQYQKKLHPNIFHDRPVIHLQVNSSKRKVNSLFFFSILKINKVFKFAIIIFFYIYLSYFPP